MSFSIIIVSALLFLYPLAFNSQHELKINNIQKSSEVKNSIEKNETLFKKLSIEKIFGSDHPINYPKDKIVTLIATGDVIPARSVNFKIHQYNNFNWPFEKTADLLKSADLTLVNLESPQIDNCPLTNEGMIFCGDKKNIQGLVFAGVDVVNLANNHSGNYGDKGIGETIDNLSKIGILSSGLSSPVFKSVNGITFAFLGYNDLDHPGYPISEEYENKIISDISLAKSKADVVIVSFHWGDEYTNMPNKKQRELAHFAIDNGADLIIGNHPHWIQPVEIYKNKLITYAHGNFVFDQMWSEETKYGVVGKYTFYENKLIDVRYLPVYIEDFGQPHFLQDLEKEKILQNMKNLSLTLSQKK